MEWRVVTPHSKPALAYSDLPPTKEVGGFYTVTPAKTNYGGWSKPCRPGTVRTVPVRLLIVSMFDDGTMCTAANPFPPDFRPRVGKM
jgi:hypothetical protein